MSIPGNTHIEPTLHRGANRTLRSVAALAMTLCYDPLIRRKGAIVDAMVAGIARVQASISLRNAKNSDELAKYIARQCPDEPTVARQVLQQTIAKHENNVQWARYLKNPDRPISLTISGQEHLDSALESSSAGVVFLIYHYGLYQMIPAVLQQAGYAPTCHKAQVEHYNGAVWDWLAHWITRTRHEHMQKCPIEFEYQSANMTMAKLGRKLRRGRSIVIAADGVSGTNFLELPFLDGAIQIATGPAQLAASAETSIVPLFLSGSSGPAGINHLEILEPLHVDDKTQDSVHKTAQQYVDLLENRVKEKPSLWLSWDRGFSSNRRD